MKEMVVNREWGNLTFTYDPLFLDENFEWEIFNLVRNHIRKTDTIFDIGAHQGLYTTFFASLASEGMIYAFEPHPDNYKYLLQNTTKYQNVKLINKAVGNETGKAILYTWNTDQILGTTGSHSLVIPRVDPDRLQKASQNITPIEVDCITIDDFVNKNGLHVDLIKMDVELWEWHAILGAKNTIETQKPKIIIEIHGGRDSTPLPQITRYFNDKNIPYKFVTGSIPTVGHIGWFLAVNFP